MNWKQHLTYGAILNFIFVGLMWYFFDWFGLEPFLVGQIIIISMLSPLVPDLDHEMGKLHQWIMAVGFVIAFAGITLFLLTSEFITTQNVTVDLSNSWVKMIIAGVLIAGISFFNANYSNHRGFWHSIPMAIIFGAIVTLIVGFNIQLGVLALFGFWTHLISDGIPFKIK